MYNIIARGSALQVLWQIIKHKSFVAPILNLLQNCLSWVGDSQALANTAAVLTFVLQATSHEVKWASWKHWLVLIWCTHVFSASEYNLLHQLQPCLTIEYDIELTQTSRFKPHFDTQFQHGVDIKSEFECWLQPITAQMCNANLKFESQPEFWRASGSTSEFEFKKLQTFHLRFWILLQASGFGKQFKASKWKL